MLRLSLPTEAHTERAATALADVLSAGDIVVLSGDLGAGKTAFVRAAVGHLGSADRVRSPTYTIAHEYETNDSRLIAHLDLYRQQGTIDDAAWGDIEPYFDAWATFVEWPDVGAERWGGRPTWTISIELRSLTARVMTVEAPSDDRAQAWLSAWSGLR